MEKLLLVFALFSDRQIVFNKDIYVGEKSVSLTLLVKVQTPMSHVTDTK